MSLTNVKKTNAKIWWWDCHWSCSNGGAIYNRSLLILSAIRTLGLLSPIVSWLLWVLIRRTRKGRRGYIHIETLENIFRWTRLQRYTRKHGQGKDFLQYYFWNFFSWRFHVFAEKSEYGEFAHQDANGCWMEIIRMRLCPLPPQCEWPMTRWESYLQSFTIHHVRDWNH